jgi:hypothetical protein
MTSAARGSMLLSQGGVTGCRLAAALAAIVSGSVLVICSGPLALGLALLVLGGLILCHCALDLYWASLLRRSPVQTPPPAGQPVPHETHFPEAAAFFVTTPGVVLGLLAAFTQGKFTLTLKVALLALAATIVLGILLHSLVISKPPAGGEPGFVVNYFFNFAFWTLTLGIFCIAFSYVV